MCKFRNIAPKVAKIAKAVNKADGKMFEVTDIALEFRYYPEISHSCTLPFTLPVRMDFLKFD